MTAEHFLRSDDCRRRQIEHNLPPIHRRDTLTLFHFPGGGISSGIFQGTHGISSSTTFSPTQQVRNKLFNSFFLTNLASAKPFSSVLWTVRVAELIVLMLWQEFSAYSSYSQSQYSPYYNSHHYNSPYLTSSNISPAAITAPLAYQHPEPHVMLPNHSPESHAGKRR